MTTRTERTTHAVVLTPPGRGAVAVVLVSGPRAIEAVDANFLAANGKPLATQPPNAIRFGHWKNTAGEEIVLSRRALPLQSAIRNPQSEIIEIHCHGGLAAAAAIVADLTAKGCQSLDWQEWLRRSNSDPIAAEAQIALAHAPTERTAAILLDQFHGALSDSIRFVLTAIDQGKVEVAANGIEAILSRAEFGLHLTTPWRVVLAGPPNVGKSSLINSLLGYSRSIVCAQPGTTRDVVTARTAIDGWPVELADTAGLRHSPEAIEAAGVELATRLLSRADLVILVSDATLSQESMQIPLPPEARVLRVRNKVDLAPRGSSEPEVIDTSAKTGLGIEALVDAIGYSLVPERPSPGLAVPFTKQQTEVLASAGSAIGVGNTQLASERLQALLAMPVAS